MGSRQIVLVSTGFSVLNTGIFWREAKTKRLFSQGKCRLYWWLIEFTDWRYFSYVGIFDRLCELLPL
jgi:hypothetical protein